MGLRVPNQAIQIPKMEDCQPLKWHKLECELVTPLYGGGVKAATIDLKMPIRASAIRGQLRFGGVYWRSISWKLGNKSYSKC
jgi:CRISPR-associated protein Cmr1